MTTELTHEQAAEIRTYKRNGRQPPKHLKWALRWEDWNLVSLTEAGRKALARYDAKYRTVEYEALEDLVDFAEAQLESIDETFAGYPEKLARYDYLRDALAKIKAV